MGKLEKSRESDCNRAAGSRFIKPYVVKLRIPSRANVRRDKH